MQHAPRQRTTTNAAFPLTKSSTFQSISYQWLVVFEHLHGIEQTKILSLDSTRPLNKMPSLAFNGKYTNFHLHIPELAARCGARPLFCCVCNLCNSRELVVLKSTRRQRQRARSARTYCKIT